ncbi:hypothetical protein ACQ86N_25555 [Puia sp. P3]|uniref:hypothetical protein n=1 Tax=Puia sp. P3 TaxID=3423952 RepID=UPI003D674EE1
MQQRQNLMEVAKFMALTQTDAGIIVLRTSVTKTALTQLENGVLSAHDYLTQVIAEDLARQNSLLHRLQFLQAEYNYSTVVGH